MKRLEIRRYVMKFGSFEKFGDSTSSSIEKELKVVVYLRRWKTYFYCHVSIRWFSLQPAVNRTLSQWIALFSYIKHLTDNDKIVGNNDNCKAIMHLMNNPRMFLQLLFIAYIAPIFSDFLRFFRLKDQYICCIQHLVNLSVSFF
jgi:hypothetical protein